MKPLLPGGNTVTRPGITCGPSPDAGSSIYTLHGSRLPAPPPEIATKPTCATRVVLVSLLPPPLRCSVTPSDGGRLVSQQTPQTVEETTDESVVLALRGGLPQPEEVVRNAFPAQISRLVSRHDATPPFR